MTAWTKACQAPPPMGFSRQEYWSGLPFPSPGDLPDPGMEPVSSSCISCLSGWILYHCTTIFFILWVSYSPVYVCTTFLTENFKAHTLLLSTCRSPPSPSDENYPNFKNKETRKFPGGPMVRSQCSHYPGPKFNPWLGN